ncbi:MAG: AtpZ/AtpI family protein [Pseudomonadota bacterium]
MTKPKTAAKGKLKKTANKTYGYGLTSITSHIIVGVGLGYMLDNYLDSKPIAMACCVLLAFIASMLDIAKKS